jgi:hypothetical protein
MSQKRTRPTSPIAGVDGRDELEALEAGGVRCVGGVGSVGGVGCVGAREDSPFPPFLTASRTARMDKGVPRPVAQPVRPEDLQPAAPPPDVERPARDEAESELAVRFLFSR